MKMKKTDDGNKYNSKICKMKSELRNINQGEIVYHKKMTTTSWHLKIRTIFPMELDIDKNPGYIIPVMIGYNNKGIPCIKKVYAVEL